MKNAHIRKLLSELPVTKDDAARLVLEAVEEMPELRSAANQGRMTLMQALRKLIREGIEAVKSQEKTVSFAHAARESLHQREKAGRRPTTLRDLRYFIRRLLLRNPELTSRPLRALSTSECQHALEQAFSCSAHNFRKGRAILHSIFRFGIQQGWCSENPVSAIETPTIEEKEITPLTISECQRLVNLADTPRFRDCLPALGIMLFAGVRPGEVARLRWADIRHDEGCLCISARQSKTGGARRVELCPPLCRMLKRLSPTHQGYQLRHICPPGWQERWKSLRRKAGFSRNASPWIPDILRHTYASYHALTHRNLPALQLQLGHRDARLLFSRYLNLRSLRRCELSHFWQLLR